MYYDFLERIQDLATGLGASVSQGGLGIRAEDNEMVGIMGENSSVSRFAFLQQKKQRKFKSPPRSTSLWCMLVSGWPHLSLQFHPFQLPLN